MATIEPASEIDDSDRVCRVDSLRPLFCPKSLAVIGASRDPGKIGNRILAALISGNFAGRIYAVNPHASQINGVASFASVHDLPEAVDLAIVVTACDAVLGVVEDCAARGVRALVVISAGFAEVGLAGRLLQDRLLAAARTHRMRMVGPNCLGLINTDPVVRLNASFATSIPAHGNIAMSSQSGGLATALLAAARRLRIGFSSFVSVGNKADISANDLLEYWEQDPQTKVILLYLESFGNPRRFARIARRVSRTKPIVAIKSGRSVAGGRAVGSHTAAMAEAELAVDALFRQCGVIRVDTLEEMFEVAAVLSHQPLPAGNRVGIVTNAGGPGILAADACEAAGLTVPAFSNALKARLHEFVSASASVSDPVDLIASASPAQIQKSIAEIIASGEVDALIVEYVSVGLIEESKVTDAIRDGANGSPNSNIPIVACLMTEDDSQARAEADLNQIPLFTFPEAGARALGHAAQYSAWKRQPIGVCPAFPDGFVAAGETCRRALGIDGPGWLSTDSIHQLLRSAGFPVAPGQTVQSADEAIQLAQTLGFPVAMKLASRTILHKSDVGGVRLNLSDPDACRIAFTNIRNKAESIGGPTAFDGILVQPMMSSGVEVVMGMIHDRQFGPLLMFGLGGIHVEILADVCFRIAPLTDRDAGEMVRSIRGYRLLEGYRGHPHCDTAALEQLLLRLSALVEAVPEIVELDLNPVMAFAEGRGCAIIDARIKVAAQTS